jgi:hypothetical protein
MTVVAELGVEEIVAHGEVLRVVPQRRDGVAVIVGHGKTGRASGSGGAFREFVRQAAVVGFLLIGIVIIVVANQLLAAVQAEWLDRIRIVGEQRQSQSVDRRSVRQRGERRFSRRIRRVRVRPEIVIERIVLVEDYDDVFDGRGKAGSVRTW